MCQISPGASEGGGLDSLREEKGGEKIMTFFCVVENVGGGVRSHPAVINLLAVRRTKCCKKEWRKRRYGGGEEGRGRTD